MTEILGMLHLSLLFGSLMPIQYGEICMKEKSIKTVRLTEKGVRQLVRMMADKKPVGKHTDLHKGMKAFRKRSHSSKTF